MTRQDLPPRLRRLDAVSAALTGAAVATPRIVYPPNGALIEWRGEELPLEASGGKRPFHWLVDGRPLTAAGGRGAIYWRPAGIGFAELTVIDAAGRSARSTVRLAP